MKKTFFALAFLSGVMLVSCNQKKSEREMNDDAEFNTPVQTDDIADNSVTDKNGNTLNLSFNNTKGTATLTLGGESFTLQQDTTASGVRMHNSDYDYEEWQGHVVLKKDGKVIFDNHGEKMQNNNKPDMAYDNANGTATMRLNGQNITLKADTTASGLRFKNSEYEYEEWKGNVVLKKNGQVVFDSRK